ncbi:MAG: DNA-directed RNA polymerase subunit alpha [Candidatus Blackburnbacteria bacterium]|nr:DNA-directed RNA polymerase subunit alpha [Candidatus Blackburnbacteria bacterium]
MGKTNQNFSSTSYKPLLFQLEQKETQETYGEFVIEPLEQGYGHTLGTSLRRVLLTGLSGAAITQVKIVGMKHQFGPVKGVKEDGVDLLLNLKKIRVSYSGEKPVKLTLSAKGKGQVLAGDIKTPADVQIANPDFVIATLADDKSKLELELQVESGVGYSPSEDRKTNMVGQIPLDADFSPLRRVNYKVEETRVGRLTNYDKLTLQVWTDGSVNASDAVKKASEILLGYFNHLVSPVVKNSSAVKTKNLETSVTSKFSVEELSLPTRIVNALIGASYETVEDIVRSNKTELAKIRNLGEKSVKIIEAALGEKGISWKGE